MPTYLTPGVYFERPEPPLAPPQRRTDVAGFVGLAERGPLHTPVRLTTWRQFQQAFGGVLPEANLALAVHAFFENGGKTCWVVRVANAAAARSAYCQLSEDNDRDNRDLAGTAYTVTAIHPGTWGNYLEVSVQTAHHTSSQHQAIAVTPENRPQVANYLLVTDIAGFEVGSRLRLTQAFEPPVQAVAVVTAVDILAGGLSLDIALPEYEFDHTDVAAPSISIESLEFTLLVWENGRVVERFANLAPEPAHARYGPTIVNAESQLVRLHPGNRDGLPDLPQQAVLQGGLNGWRQLNIYDYTGNPAGEVYGLAALAAVDEVGILAMPDLTLAAQPPTPLSRAPRRRLSPCSFETAGKRLALRGRLVDVETGQPLIGAAIELDDGLMQHHARSNHQGQFHLPNILPGRLELVLTLAGFAQRIHTVPPANQSSPNESDLGDIALTPLDLPPTFAESDILYGQMAMVAQCERLRDRVALLDPPLAAGGDLLDLSGLQSWRARFSSAFAALYYPWLLVRDPVRPTQRRWLPPSGHVAGIYAATDLTEGVFRPPANRRLAQAEGVGRSVDDALQGVLNPQGINVIRVFPGRGIRVYGARTLSYDSAWRFVNVRRLLNLIEEIISDSLQWAVFEPNSEALWFGIRLTLITLLDSFWRQGAFVGDTAEAAYMVRCDAITNTPDDRAAGRAIAQVGVAPTVPYEFIVLRLGLTADELQISEV